MRLVADHSLTNSQFFQGKRLLSSFLFLLEEWAPQLLSLLIGPNNPYLKRYELSLESGSLVPFSKFIPNFKSSPAMNQWFFGKPMWTSLGRLGLLEEAAAKIRVIAIVDPLTQWLFKPLHDWIFSILGRLPMDGTFDQDKPLVRLLDLSKKSSSSFIASYDLSAATDRLPVSLQVAIFSPIFGERIARSWSHVLVDRPYQLKSKAYFYAVGQPMGALSSWASLAITHHFM